VARDAVAVWITGLPASGKSTLTRALCEQLKNRGIEPAVLESDDLRKVMTPQPRYDEQERDAFYRQMIFVGTLLTRHGVPVIFDATANRRKWRDEARRAMPNFLEVFVNSPLELCMARDPKGIYRKARRGEASTVPGVHSAYEPPEHPDLTVDGTEDPVAAARRIVELMQQRESAGSPPEGFPPQHR